MAQEAYLDFVSLNQYQELVLKTEAQPDAAMCERIARVGAILGERLALMAVVSKQLEDIKRYIFYNGQRKPDSTLKEEHLRTAETSENGYTVMELNEEQRRWIRDLHAFVGVAGELHEKWEKFDKNPLCFNVPPAYFPVFDKKNIAEEFGDMLWYACVGLDSVGIPLLSCARANISKLAVRHGEKFKPEAAAERDLASEDSALAKELSHGSD